MNCIICSTAATEGVALANGKILHSACFRQIVDEAANAEQKVLAAQSEIESLQSTLRSQEGLVGTVASFFGVGADPRSLRAKLIALEAALNERQRSNAQSLFKVTPIFDLMLDYPPDWSVRRSAVLARDKACMACGSRSQLQVHHTTPLARGGTNRIENLKLLCEKCHQASHGGKTFSKFGFSEPLPFAQRVQVIEGAISEGSDIEFLYRKPTDSASSKRRVTPLEIVEMEHERNEGRTLCLQGYCHKRKANRVFALKRMTGVKRV